MSRIGRYLRHVRRHEASGKNSENCLPGFAAKVKLGLKSPGFLASVIGPPCWSRSDWHMDGANEMWRTYGIATGLIRCKPTRKFLTGSCGPLLPVTRHR